MDYKKLMQQYQQDIILSLIDLLKIPSVYDEKTSCKEMPFGKNVDKALKKVGELGEKLGFKVDYCDGYATELTMGEGKKLIGIFAHTDVVPAIGEWNHDPFDPIIKDEKLYARGSSDDKGPFVAALYATKALFDANLLKDTRVRIVVGGDEERGSKCLDYYFHNLHKEAPTYGFTPDSDFPLIYGEKGICDFNAKIRIDAPFIHKMNGGLVSNAVIDKFDVYMDNDKKFVKYLKEKNVNFIDNNDHLTFVGKAVHGSTPELGINAALIAFKELGDFYKINELSLLGNKLMDTSGKSFNGYSSSKLLKDTTYCLGIAKYENGVLDMTVNFRYNELVKPAEYISNFDEFFGTKSTHKEPSPYLLYDPNCDLVKTLLKAYREETDDNSEPLTTGGGTYAKHAPNTVAFGALFPGRISSMHEPNEFMPVEDIYLSAVIYAHAIKLLGDL